MTDIFVKNLMDYTTGYLDDSVYEHIQNCFLDYVGCALSGTKLLEQKAEKLLYINYLCPSPL